MNALTIRDLSVVKGEPRVRDIMLAERLEFARVRDLRKIINRSHSELSRYGEVSRHHGAKPGRGTSGGRPQSGFYLNEAQALLVCMFSQTDRAGDVRQQLIEVFLAWRHGQMVKAPTKRRTARLGQGAAGPKPGEPGWTDPMRPIDERRAMLVRFRDFHAVREDERLVHMVAHMVPPGGRGMKLRNPDWWHDIEVRHMLIRLHRQCTVHQASELVEQSFGRARTPGERSINRFWVRLDGLFGTGRRLH